MRRHPLLRVQNEVPQNHQLYLQLMDQRVPLQDDLPRERQVTSSSQENILASLGIPLKPYRTGEKPPFSDRLGRPYR